MLVLLIIVLLVFALVVYKLLKQLKQSLKSSNAAHSNSYKIISGACLALAILVLGFYGFAIHYQKTWACGSPTMPQSQSWVYIAFITSLLLWVGFTSLLRQGRSLSAKKFLLIILGSLFLTVAVLFLIYYLAFFGPNCSGGYGPQF